MSRSICFASELHFLCDYKFLLGELDICFLAFPTGHQALRQHNRVRNKEGGLKAHLYTLQKLLQDLLFATMEISEDQ